MKAPLGKDEAAWSAAFATARADRDEAARLARLHARQAAWLRAKRARSARARDLRAAERRARQTERYAAADERDARRRTFRAFEDACADVSSDALDGVLARLGLVY